MNVVLAKVMLGGLVIGMVLESAPAVAGDGLLDRVIGSVKESVQSRQTRAEQNVVDGATGVADTALDVATQPVDAAVNSATSIASDAITAAVASGGETRKALEAGLDAGALEIAGLFAAGQAKLEPNSGNLLDALARLLMERGATVLIEGHFLPAEPAQLSVERAQAVKQHLLKEGVAEEQLHVARKHTPLGADADVAATISVRTLD